MASAWLAQNPKFQVDTVVMVSEGDSAFEEELKEVWKLELQHDLQLLEERLRQGEDHGSIWLLTCKVTDSATLMGAEGVRRVGHEMALLVLQRRYADVGPLLAAVRREFEEYNLLWGLWRTLQPPVSGRQRANSL